MNVPPPRFRSLVGGAGGAGGVHSVSSLSPSIRREGRRENWSGRTGGAGIITLARRAGGSSPGNKTRALLVWRDEDWTAGTGWGCDSTSSSCASMAAWVSSLFSSFARVTRSKARGAFPPDFCFSILFFCRSFFRVSCTGFLRLISIPLVWAATRR